MPMKFFSVTSLSFWKFWTRPGKGERRKGKGKIFDQNEVSVFISPKEVTPSHTVLVSGWSESSRDRCRRCCWTGSTTLTAPSTSSLVITMSSWRRFGSSLPRSGRSSLINKKDKTTELLQRGKNYIGRRRSEHSNKKCCCRRNGEDFPNWKWTPVIKRILLTCLHRLFNVFVFI